MKLQLSFPVNSPIISQVFGANSQFYSDPKYGGIKGHNGVDFMAQHGYPIYATHDGLASYQIDAGGGHGVVIITDKEFEGGGGQICYWKTISWHLCDGLKEPHFASPFQGKTGFTPVQNGDLLGYADNTGASTGDHLHFGLKPVAKGEDWGTWLNLAQSNGYGGAVDPQPYFDRSTPVQIQIMTKEISLLSTLIEKLKELLNMKSS
jgi:murein DD-endopeptidase MepM/ murein hydrolase activator NlpD